MRCSCDYQMLSGIIDFIAAMSEAIERRGPGADAELFSCMGEADDAQSEPGQYPAQPEWGQGFLAEAERTGRSVPPLPEASWPEKEGLQHRQSRFLRNER